MPKETIPLRERLERYFKKNHGTWIASGEIQRLVATYTTQTPRTCVRRLQEMAEQGILEKKLVKGHTHYRLSEKKPVTWQEARAAGYAMWDSVK